MKATRRFDFSILAILAFISLTGSAHAQPLANGYARTSTVMVGYEKKYIPWEQFDKTLVEVEGVAWGTADKGLGEHLVLTQNDIVYLENIDLLNTDLDGRLLNVVGIFRKKRVEKAPPGAQGYGQSFDYYSIEVIAARKIEKVEQYQVLPARGEWIVPGMLAAEALQKVQARQWPEYHRSVTAARDDSQSRAFQINAALLLKLTVLNGKLIGVSEIHLSDSGTRYPFEKHVELRGYELPPLAAAKVMSK